MITLLLFLITPGQDAPQALSPPAPSQACFETLADAEGEMAMANDPEWREKTLAELRHQHRLQRDRIEAELTEYSHQRDDLQRDFDDGRLPEDDFRSARSEIQREVRRLIGERDAGQLPGCGV